MNYRAVFIVFMGLVLIISLGMARAPKTDGQMAIDFTLADLEGVKVKLSDYKGKVVFLNFWATWCPPCRREMPSMQELHEKLKKKDFIMLAVSIDRTGLSAVGPFVEKNGYTFKVLVDPSGKAASKYRVSSIPATFIIDKEGKIIDRVIGGRDWSSASVVKMLKEIIDQ